jgi:hypothetical protein
MIATLFTDRAASFDLLIDTLFAPKHTSLKQKLTSTNVVISHERAAWFLIFSEFFPVVFLI